MSRATIRPASLEDLPALLDLYVQLSATNAATQPARAAAGLRRILAREDISLLVAEIDGRVAGTVMLVVVPGLTHNARPWIQLENMVVDGSIRRSGVGRALLAAAFDLAREHDAYKIQLESAAYRTEAHEFYEAAGFTRAAIGFRRYFD